MRWIVVMVKSQQEESALRNLMESGFHCYLPQLTLRKGRKTKLIPMFRGYLFVQVDPEDMPVWRTIGSHRGVIKILMRTNSLPAFLPDMFVPLLIEQGVREENTELVVEYKKGARIKFTTGPLVGILGIVHWSNKQRVSLLVDLLGTDTIVQSTVHMIAPIGASYE